MKLLPMFGFNTKDKKKKGGNNADPAVLEAGVVGDGFLQFDGKYPMKGKNKGKKENNEEEERDRDGVFQPEGGRHPVFSGRLRIEELEPKISP